MNDAVISWDFCSTPGLLFILSASRPCTQIEHIARQTMIIYIFQPAPRGNSVYLKNKRMLPPFFGQFYSRHKKMKERNPTMEKESLLRLPGLGHLYKKVTVILECTLFRRRQGGKGKMKWEFNSNPPVAELLSASVAVSLTPLLN